MSRLENLRQLWREHPENSNNWDLERWKAEHPRFLRLGYVYMIVFGFFAIISSFFSYYGPSITFSILMTFFGLVFFLADVYYVRTIRRLEQPEGNA